MTKKKTLLKEGTVRQFMKLANLQPLTTGFVETLYEKKQTATDKEDEHLGAEDGKEADKKQSFKDRRKEERGEDRAKGEKPKGTEGTNESIATNPHHVVSEQEEVELGDEEEVELGGGEEMELGGEEELEEPAPEGDLDVEGLVKAIADAIEQHTGVTVDVAGGEEEVEMGAEEELEGPEGDLEVGAEEEEVLGEDGLNAMVSSIAENVTKRVKALARSKVQQRRKKK